MKKYFLSFGKLILVAIILIACNVIFNYLFEVIFETLIGETNAYIFDYNPIGFIAGQFLLFFFIAGWAYLLAAIIYHFYVITDFIYKKFKYIIIIYLLFYILVTYKYFGISTILLIYFAALSVLYYVFVKRQEFGRYIQEVALWYVIFLLFFFFYWMSSMFQSKMLIEHLIIYVPLAFIGQKTYARLFPIK